MIIDIVLAVIGLAGLIVFAGIIIAFVPAPPLIAVVVIVLLMAAFDFFLEIRQHLRNRS